jgi:hypothetical protein
LAGFTSTLRWIDLATGMRRSMLLEQSNAHEIVLLQQFIATDGWMPPPRPAAGTRMYSREQIAVSTSVAHGRADTQQAALAQ